MERLSLAAKGRDSGKGSSRRLRAAGALPAVVYGKGLEPKAVSVELRPMTRALKTAAGLNVLIDLAIDGASPMLVRVKEYAAHPLKNTLQHVDFQSINMSETIDVEVPLHFVGTAPGVKEGGIVEISRRTIAVRCLPTDIPSAIDVDISQLQIGQSVHANDLQIPAGVTWAHAENFSVVQVVAPQKEEEVVVAVAPDAVPASSEVVKPAEAGAETKKGE